jgi:hypothetical protein
MAITHTVITDSKITTRVRPVPNLSARPAEEVITTHAASCPECSRETRIGLGPQAAIYGGCVHIAAIEQSTAGVAIRFEVRS